MNFGEKFPYALLTFSQKFVEADCGPHLIPKTCQADCSTHPTPSPKSLSKLVIGYTTPQSLPARPAPHQLYTHHTQSHNPAHTPPPAS